MSDTASTTETTGGDRDRLLTTRQLAEILGVKPHTILAWASRGVIPCIRLTRKVIRYDRDSVMRSLASAQRRAERAGRGAQDPPPRASVGEVPESSRAEGAGPGRTGNVRSAGGGDTPSPADPRPDATSPWEAIRRINEAPWHSGVKHLMLALLQWRGATTGEVWPSVLTIARAMGVATRSVRAHLNRAIGCGALEVIGPRTGGRCPTTYLMNLPAPPSPQSKQAAHPCPNLPPTPAETCRPPLPKSAAHPCRNLPPNQQENQQENQQQQPGAVVADVFARLRIEDLRSHPNATPDRLAWIEREAPRARNPAGWARACIVEGWAVPEPTPEDAAEARRARIAAVDRAYRRLPRDQRRALLERARAEHPRLRERTDADFELIGAAKRLLAPNQAFTPIPPKRNADDGYPQGRNASQEAIGSILARSVGEVVPMGTTRRRAPPNGSNGVIRRSG